MCVFPLPITFRYAFASAGLTVLLLSDASQTYKPVSKEDGVGIIRRRPLLRWRPSRFHDTTRLSRSLRGQTRIHEKQEEGD